LKLLTGVTTWALKDLASTANSELKAFLDKYGGASAKFNAVYVDWPECGEVTGVPELIIGLNK